MAKYLITGADGQLGQCFQAIAHEFSSDELIFVNQDKVDITSTKSLKKFYSNNPFEGIINYILTLVEKAEKEEKKANINAWELKI